MPAERADADSARTLLLLRHAKSAYPPGVRDHDRPLSPRGRRQAALAGLWISAHGPKLDRVLCSTAARTRETLTATYLDERAPVDYHSEIYEAWSDDLLDLVTAADPADRTLLMIGHGPALPDLAAELSGPGSDTRSLAAMATKFPTSAIAVLSITGAWADTSRRTARLTRFVVPGR
jgi:phosphohistidine phosphatase